MEVLCACDQSYLPHAGTMLCSLLEHNTVSRIHVFHGSVSENELTRLRRFVVAYGSEIVFYKIEQADIEQLRVDKWGSAAVYYRLLAGHLLPADIDKVLYLDCDLIIRRSLAKLWNTDISDCVLGAVPNYDEEPGRMLGLPTGAKYFNSGVLLINLRSWRRNSTAQQAIAFAKNNPEKVHYWDQDALNGVLVHQWRELPPYWNWQHQTRGSGPAVVHFLTSDKPWFWSNDHPFKREYKMYRRKTPWRRYRPEGQPYLPEGTGRYLRRSARFILPHGLRQWLRSSIAQHSRSKLDGVASTAASKGGGLRWAQNTEDRCTGAGGAGAPRIEPLSPGTRQPLWSVMIPTYNCAKYLEQALRSVLAQDLGPTQMDIEVVDDCSDDDDPEAVVKSVGQGRVTFHRKPRNEGATANFNTCIERSRGRYVHILHGDDFVAPDYYLAVAALIDRYPDVGLYATRCFFVDANSVLTAVSPRVESLETPSKDARPFYYDCPIQFASATVPRTSYEKLGGFRTDLVHTADVEMWARIISSLAGVVSNDVKANYRVSENDSERLARTGENVRDFCRLQDIFASRYPGFSLPLARREAAEKALYQYKRFTARGETAAARINRELWHELAPFRGRMITYLKESNFLRRIAAAHPKPD